VCVLTVFLRRICLQSLWYVLAAVGNRAEVVRVRIRGVWPPSAVTFNDVPLAATSSASDATTPCWWYDCKTFSVNVQCFWPKYGSSTVTIRVALSSLSTSLIDGGLSGKIALIDRIVDALGEQCPPEVTEFQELIQAVELSCILYKQCPSHPALFWALSFRCCKRIERIAARVVGGSSTIRCDCSVAGWVREL
jgi:hypothetical protein